MNAVLAIAVPVAFVVLTVVIYVVFQGLLRDALSRMPWPVHRQQQFLVRMRSVLLGWALATAVIAVFGFFADFSSFPPRLFLVVGIPLIAILVITFLPVTGQILQHTEITALTRLQFFRVVVELLLWALYFQNLLPVQMTFEGRNFDVLAGLSAPLAARFIVGSRWGMVLWNIVSLGLLVNIVVVAVLSLPTPMRVFINEPANTIVAQFPYVWLPAMLVPMAYGLHFLSLRKLLSTK